MRLKFGPTQIDSVNFSILPSINMGIYRPCERTRWLFYLYFHKTCCFGICALCSQTFKTLAFDIFKNILYQIHENHVQICLEKYIQNIIILLSFINKLQQKLVICILEMSKTTCFFFDQKEYNRQVNREYWLPTLDRSIILLNQRQKKSSCPFSRGRNYHVNLIKKNKSPPFIMMSLDYNVADSLICFYNSISYTTLIYLLIGWKVQNLFELLPRKVHT